MMNRDNITAALKIGDGQAVEFALDCRPIHLGQQVTAFLNSGGGHVVCGVSDKGQILGCDIQLSADDLERDLKGDISPAALFSVTTEHIDKKCVLVVEVPSGKDIPYAFRNDIFVRMDGKTQKADVETIRDMVLRRQVEPERWERRFSSAEPDTELAVNEIRTVIRAAKRTARIRFRQPDDMSMALEDLAVQKYGRLTNAGDVLFTANPEVRHPQVRLRAVCYAADKTGDTYRDMKSFEGPLVTSLEAAYGFIIRNTQTPARFKGGGLRRTDDPFYPEEAVREGLVNAFAHRDYADFSGGIAIHIYPGRLEIWNSGGFPEGVTSDKLMAGHISVLRNPDIAHVLYIRGMMEKLGRGSILIQQACAARGLPAPQWRSENGRNVTLTFFAPEVTTDVDTEVTTDVDTEVTTEVGAVIMALDGEMTRRELQEKIGLKNDEYFRKAYIVPALNKGYVEMTIPDKPRSRMQKYRLTKKGRMICDR